MKAVGSLHWNTLNFTVLQRIQVNNKINTKTENKKPTATTVKLMKWIGFFYTDWNQLN